MKRGALFILGVFLCVLIVLSPRTYSIPERNTEYIPGTIGVSDLSTFIKSLEELKNLNDPVANMYIEEIKSSISSGDYDKANKLLAELQTYLKEKYGNNLSGLDPELAKDIAFVESIKEVNERGTIVDISKYLNDLAGLIKNPDELKQLLDIANKLENGLPLSDAEKALLGKMLEDFNIKEAVPSNVSLNELSNLFNNTGVNNLTVPKISVPSSLNMSLPSSNPSIPSLVSLGSPGSLVLPSIPTEYLVAVLIPVIIASMIYLARDRFSTIDLIIRKKLAKAIATTMSRIKHIDDPVARLYGIWLSLAKTFGYPRYSWETPREHLQKVRDNILRKRGSIIVKLYEMKFYGMKEPRSDEIEKAKKELEAE